MNRCSPLTTRTVPSWPPWPARFRPALPVPAATIEGATDPGRWPARAAGGASGHPGDRSTSVARTLASRVARVLARGAEHRGAASTDTDPWEPLMDHHRTATTTVTTRLDAGPSASSRRWTPPAPAGAGRTWVDTRSTEVLLAALDTIATEGWDGPTAGELLRVVRSPDRGAAGGSPAGCRAPPRSRRRRRAGSGPGRSSAARRCGRRGTRGRCCGWRCAARSATRSRRR